MLFDDEKDTEAIGRFLASESPRKPEVWPWLAVAARNVARQRGVSIFDLLQAPDGTWGHNDPKLNPSGKTHWASTSHEPSKQTRKFAEQFLSGEVPTPFGSNDVTSFFEVDDHGVHKDPRPFLNRNPELEYVTQISGWNFYRSTHSNKKVATISKPLSERVDGVSVLGKVALLLGVATVGYIAYEVVT